MRPIKTKKTNTKWLKIHMRRCVVRFGEHLCLILLIWLCWISCYCPLNETSHTNVFYANSIIHVILTLFFLTFFVLLQQIKLLLLWLFYIFGCALFILAMMNSSTRFVFVFVFYLFACKSNKMRTTTTKKCKSAIHACEFRNCQFHWARATSYELYR